MELFADPWRLRRGHQLALVDAGATVAADASIGPFAISGGARIGLPYIIVHPHVTIGRLRDRDDCVIHAHVHRERVRISHRVIVQDARGDRRTVSGFARRQDGTHYGSRRWAASSSRTMSRSANTTVDRPRLARRGCGGDEIDNLVQIAHGVRIGRNVLLAAQVGVAGSSVVETRSALAGQVGVAGHITIGEGTVATAQTGIRIRSTRVHLGVSSHFQP